MTFIDAFAASIGKVVVPKTWTELCHPVIQVVVIYHLSFTTATTRMTGGLLIKGDLDQQGNEVPYPREMLQNSNNE